MNLKTKLAPRCLTISPVMNTLPRYNSPEMNTLGSFSRFGSRDLPMMNHGVETHQWWIHKGADFEYGKLHEYFTKIENVPKHVYWDQEFWWKNQRQKISWYCSNILLSNFSLYFTKQNRSIGYLLSEFWPSLHVDLACIVDLTCRLT